MTDIISGKELAANICTTLATKVTTLPRKPKLVAIIVGDDPASHIYVNRKEAAAKRAGIDSVIIRMHGKTTQSELLAAIDNLNDLNDVDGILVQLPLPAHIDTATVIEAVHPEKDVDGFHPLNYGRLFTGNSLFVPCTTKAIMRLLTVAGASLPGAKALMVGSGSVGKPTAVVLNRAGATVTVTNSKTRDLPELVANAEIVIAAVGRPNLIRGNYVRRNAIIIDVGINRLANGQVVGDVAFDECLGIARAITPVPGGVGPMTIACLLENTVEAAIRKGY